MQATEQATGSESARHPVPQVVAALEAASAPVLGEPQLLVAASHVQVTPLFAKRIAPPAVQLASEGGGTQPAGV